MAFDISGVEPGSDIETLFRTVGFVVVQWGCAEQTLDMIVSMIYHRYNTHSLPKKRPSFLTHKTKFLRKCFNEYPEIQLFSTTSVDRIPDLTHDRCSIDPSWRL